MENNQSKSFESAKKKPFSMSEKIGLVILMLIASVGAGFVGGYYSNDKTAVNQGREAQQQIVNNESGLIAQLAEEVGQSVVSVNVISTGVTDTFFGAREFSQKSAGTGFIVSADGIIVTNRHVILENTDNISVTLSDGTELDDISVVGRTGANDPLDIAFLKVNDKKGKDLKPVKLGDSSKVNVGDKVIAIGNALGQFQNTVTAGIISGYGRNIEASAGSAASGSETLQNLFQTDTAINQGNSGGPLVNMSGEVIGINTAVAAGSAENIGFAIPISDISGLIKSVLDTGELRRPYLGVRYINLTDDIAYQLNLDTKRGSYLAPLQNGSPIIKDSPAAKAGLKEKDIIVKVNDNKINDRNSLASVLGRLSVGDKVKLTVIRDGAEMTIEATLEAAE
ncbi:trypsin-like peptidase domain-containing protein [Candidatus Parcubacteria bacterium]|nr:trypsin-like peptidase domain-containing protein [Candidatus Parcubacteria bacterium]